MQSSAHGNFDHKIWQITYPNFEVKSRALPKIILGQATYGFKAQEANNPKL